MPTATYTPSHRDHDGNVVQWTATLTFPYPVRPVIRVFLHENAARALCGLPEIKDGWDKWPRRKVKGPAGDLNPANREQSEVRRFRAKGDPDWSTEAEEAPAGRESIVHGIFRDAERFTQPGMVYGADAASRMCRPLVQPVDFGRAPPPKPARDKALDTALNAIRVAESDLARLRQRLLDALDDAAKEAGR